MVNTDIEYIKYTIHLEYPEYNTGITDNGMGVTDNGDITPLPEIGYVSVQTVRWYKVIREDINKYYLNEIYLDEFPGSLMKELNKKAAAAAAAPAYFVYKSLTMGNLPTSDSGAFGKIEPVDKDEIIIRLIQ